MTNAHDPDVRALFLASLAIAGAACAGADAPPRTAPIATATATPTAVTSASAVATVSIDRSPKPRPTSEPQPDLADPKVYARTFGAVDDLAKALPPGLELLGFVDIDGKGTTCSSKPCPAEWKALVKKAGSHGAVVRRSGALEIIMASDFENVVGKIDTREKAALRARIEDYHQPATCATVHDEGFDCAAGASPTGLAVRKAGDRFEVMTFGFRDVCGGGAFGQAKALGVVTIDQTGKVLPATNEFTLAIDTVSRRDVDCRYPTRGRMFEGFVDRGDESTELAYYLRAARQEAAAVHAFERLARELDAHGAPRALVLAALRSADDERRHARAFRREATRISGALGLAPDHIDPGAPEAFAVRSLEEMLLENAIEGCANETYAALVVTHQAEHAPNPRFRRVLAAIAVDEQAHADLAHRIHAWGQAALDAGAAAAVEAARHDANDRMGAAPSVTPLGLALGEPEAHLAHAAFRHVSNALAARAA